MGVNGEFGLDSSTFWLAGSNRSQQKVVKTFFSKRQRYDAWHCKRKIWDLLLTRPQSFLMRKKAGAGNDEKEADEEETSSLFFPPSHHPSRLAIFRKRRPGTSQGSSTSANFNFFWTTNWEQLTWPTTHILFQVKSKGIFHESNSRLPWA